MISISDKRSLVRFAGEIALGAGKILHRGFRKSMKVNYKGAIDPVTEYDLRSEKYIITQIKKKFPDHIILAEESGGDRCLVGGFRWVIDPLDGTVNFAHGFPVYCVSIAVEYNNQTVVGVVYDPERKELFTAALGEGAKLNGKKIGVSTTKRIDRAMFSTGFAYDVQTNKKNNLGLFARMIKNSQAVRRPGSAAIDLCWLAAGRIDGFWELYLYPWDTAAASLIVTEAGGKVTRMNGNKYSIFDDDILATNRHIHRAASRVLTGK